VIQYDPRELMKIAPEDMIKLRLNPFEIIQISVSRYIHYLW